jgi:perosamine synthetase
MKIPISKPYLGEKEAQSAYDTILSGWITQGPRVADFEEKFANYVGSKYAVAVSNCTTALHLSMIVAGIGKDDEVICPSMSYIATANCIKYVNAIPVFAEIDPSTMNLDINDVKHRITKNTKAILIVHQVGFPADIDEFQNLCNQYGLKLIEDAACAIGSEYKGKKIGSHSDLVCFSFHPRKVITTGDGGMIATSNKEYYDRLKLLRQHGMSVNDRVRHESKTLIFEDHVEIGYNYRMTDIQASVGINQLDSLDWIIKERRKIAIFYTDQFKELDFISLPSEIKDTFSNFQSYSIFLKPECPVSRNELMEKMLEAGIATRRGIMTIHRELAYKDLNGIESLPITEDTSDKSIIIPLYVGLKNSELEYIVKCFKTFTN